MGSAIRRRVSFGLLSLGLSAALGCNARQGRDLQGVASDEWTRSYTLAPGGELQIVGADGTIEVRQGSGSTVEVRAERRVRANTNESAAAMVAKVRISEDVSPDRVILRNEGLGGILLGVAIDINFHVTLPPGTRVRVHAASGDVTLADLDGTVVASTTNGAVTGTALRGGVDARSTNGRVTIDMAAVGRDPIDLRTVNGQIQLTLPADTNANIAANTVNGSLDVQDLPFELTGEQTRRRARGRLNDGGTPIELTVTNGDIHIRPRP